MSLKSKKKKFIFFFFFFFLPLFSFPLSFISDLFVLSDLSVFMLYVNDYWYVWCLFCFFLLPIVTIFFLSINFLPFTDLCMKMYTFFSVLEVFEFCECFVPVYKNMVVICCNGHALKSCIYNRNCTEILSHSQDKSLKIYSLLVNIIFSYVRGGNVSECLWSIFIFILLY